MKLIAQMTCYFTAILKCTSTGHFTHKATGKELWNGSEIMQLTLVGWPHDNDNTTNVVRPDYIHTMVVSKMTFI